MATRRYTLALELLMSTDWRRFEQFASAVLAAEFGSYRPTATSSGDKGRDGELYSGPDPSVVFQFSVTADWRSKIRETAQRVSDQLPAAKVLIYVTSQSIGAAWDSLRPQVHEDHGLYLDVRDRDWLLGRAVAGGPVEVAFEELAVDIVDPHIAGDVTQRHSNLLTDLESRAALTYLEMRWADDTSEKGLTGLTFEGLARSVLRGTDSEHRMPRPEIQARVRQLLPTHDPATVNRFTDSALDRMSRRAVRHYRAKDEYCLSYEERLRLDEGIARLELEEGELRAAITERVSIMLGDGHEGAVIAEVADRIRRVLDRFLLSRGEAFAASVTSGNLRELELSAIRDTVLSDIADRPPATTASIDPQLIESIAQSLLLEPEEKVHGYLARLAGSYVLFAFLHETPDVQGAVAKMFSEGEVWLDSSVVLPLLADTLEEEDHRHFSALIEASRGAGIDLFIARGAIEEVERHLNRVQVCARTPATAWRGDYPYLYSRYLDSGRALGRVSNWIETFVGQARREEDLELYLADAHGVRIREFANVETEDSALWSCALAEWQRRHEERRSRRADYDAMMTLRLARHDAESHVGILGLRSRQAASPFGYRAWWLTLDRGAFGAHRAVTEALGRRDMPPPIMSPDFLRNYLAFGPGRRLVPRTLEMSLPVVADIQLSRYVPPELVAVANEARERNRALPERLIRRRVRDALDAARARQGNLAKGGLGELQQRLEVSE